MTAVLLSIAIGCDKFPSGFNAIDPSYTKNLRLALVTQLNVNLWTIPKNGPSTLDNIVGLDFSPVLAVGGNVAAFPWQVCAQLVAASLRVMVWTGTDPKPAWDDPVHVRTAVLPPAWVYAGNYGWYIGHLHRGQTFEYTAISATAPESIPTSTTNTTTTSEPRPDTTTTTEAPPDTTTTTEPPPNTTTTTEPPPP